MALSNFFQWVVRLFLLGVGITLLIWWFRPSAEDLTYDSAPGGGGAVTTTPAPLNPFTGWEKEVGRLTPAQIAAVNAAFAATTAIVVKASEGENFPDLTEVAREAAPNIARELSGLTSGALLQLALDHANKGVKNCRLSEPERFVHLIAFVAIMKARGTPMESVVLAVKWLLCNPDGTSCIAPSWIPNWMADLMQIFPPPKGLAWVWPADIDCEKLMESRDGIR